MKQFLLENAGILLSALATGFGGWIYGRKKANAEADALQIENYDKGLLYYQKLVDGLGLQLTKAIEELKKSEIEKQAVIREFTLATHKIHELEKTVENLTDELKKYKNFSRKS